MARRPQDLDVPSVRNTLAGLTVPTIEVHDTIGSTQDRARALLRKGASLPALVLAWRQSAGRGRGGRAWSSPLGGLWLSYVLPGAHRAPGRLPWTLLVSLELARALERRLAVAVQLKWPNDLFLHGRKLGGILVDLDGDHACIGIGLNVAVSPADVAPSLAQPTAALGEAPNGAPDAGDLLRVVVQSVHAAFALPPALDPVGVLSEAWQRSVLADRPIHVHPSGGEPFTGRAVGLDRRGALLVLADGSDDVRALLSAHLELF